MFYTSDTVSTVSTHFGKIIKGEKISQEKKKSYSLIKLQLQGMVETINLEQKIEALDTQVFLIEQQLSGRLEQLEKASATVDKESPTAATQLASISKERDEINQLYLAKIDDIREAIRLERDKLEDINLSTKRKLNNYLHKASKERDAFANDIVQIVNNALQEAGNPPMTQQAAQQLIALITNDTEQTFDECCRIATQYPNENTANMGKSLQKELGALSKIQIDKIVNFVTQLPAGGASHA